MTETLKLNKTLKLLLAARGISASTLSRHLDIPPQTLHNWLSGADPRNMMQVKKVADYFKVSIDYLFFEDETPSQSEIKEKIINAISIGNFEVFLRKI